MIAALRLPRQLRLDLPLRRDASGRFLPWIIALMVYLAAMGGVGVIWLGDTLSQWDASLASALTLQIPADASQPRIEMALGALKQTQGVVSARLLEPEETAKLLQPWLGNSVRDRRSAAAASGRCADRSPRGDRLHRRCANSSI